MHKVRIVGIKTLESGKFNGDTGLMENPCKGTVKFADAVPITEAGVYNNSDCIVMTLAEYDNIVSAVPVQPVKETLQDMRSILMRSLDVITKLSEKLEAEKPEGVA